MCKVNNRVNKSIAWFRRLFFVCHGIEFTVLLGQSFSKNSLISSGSTSYRSPLSCGSLHVHIL